MNAPHNIAAKDERKRALLEIVRVLKPGGRAVLCDCRNVGEYARILEEQGMRNARKQWTGWVGFWPMFAACGEKREEPAASEA